MYILYRSDHLLEHLVDHPCRIGLLEAEHVTLRIEPVSEVGALDEESVTIRFDEVWTAYTDKGVLRKVRFCLRFLCAGQAADCQGQKNKMSGFHNRILDFSTSLEMTVKSLEMTIYNLFIAVFIHSTRFE